MIAVSVGRKLFGKVDVIAGQSAMTMFQMAGLPLFPLQSCWALARRGGAFRGLPTVTNGKSVLATYVRLLGWAVPLALVVPATPRGKAPNMPLLVAAGVLFLAWAVAAVVSYLPGDKAARTVLGKVTGIYAPARVFDARVSAAILKLLAPALAQRNISTNLASHRSAEASGASAPFVYAYASYAEQVRPGEGWAEVAARALPKAVGGAETLDKPVMDPFVLTGD
jgi:hypothetical protein